MQFPKANDEDFEETREKGRNMWKMNLFVEGTLITLPN